MAPPSSRRRGHRITPLWPGLGLLSLDDDFFRPFFTDVRDVSKSRSAYSRPSYSYAERDGEIVLEVEMPGVAKDDVKVNVEGRKLIMRGKRYKKKKGSCEARQVEVEECKEGHKERELRTEYKLEVKIGEGGDLDKLYATSCGDGLLVVHVPKKQVQTRKIELS